MGFHSEVVTLLIWSLINSAVFQPANTNIPPSSVMELNNSHVFSCLCTAKSFSRETCRPAEGVLVGVHVCALMYVC